MSIEKKVDTFLVHGWKVFEAINILAERQEPEKKLFMSFDF